MGSILLSCTARLSPGGWAWQHREEQAKYPWINLQSYSSPCFKAAVPSENSDRPLRSVAGDHGWQGPELAQPKGAVSHLRARTLRWILQGVPGGLSDWLWSLDGRSSNSTSTRKPSGITQTTCSLPKSYRPFLFPLEHLILCLWYSHYCRSCLSSY